ncbi:MAG: hypothetical protein QM709_06730 [Spongiibacteraceae bacterium]
MRLGMTSAVRFLLMPLIAAFAVALFFAMPAVAAPAEKKSDEATVVLHSTITGNQEQPKVLYIVPWQSPGSADRLMQPAKPVLDDVFAPVDRAEFNRELKFRENVTTPAP